ncbi:MAG: DUF6293 family protein [Candidatus Hadarchaeota archaeon]
MTKYVHLIPVSPKKDLLLSSLKKSNYPVQKAYLIMGRESELNDGLYEATEELEDTLKALIEIEKIYVDHLDVYSSVLDLIAIIKKELGDGNEVFINTTEPPGVLPIVCYICAQLTRTRLYAGIPKKGERANSVEVNEIPIPTPMRISKDKLSVLKTIEEHGGEVSSIEELIELCEGTRNEKRDYMAQRARMSYLIKDLRKKGLLDKQRVGKSVQISLTELGRAYIVLNS